MSQPERTVAHILDNGLFRAGTVVSFVVFVAVASWNVASWFTTIEKQLVEIELQLEKGTADRWRRTEMYRWCRETELVNPDWKCGEIE